MPIAQGNFRLTWTRHGHDYLMIYRDWQYTLSIDDGDATEIPVEEGVRLTRAAYLMTRDKDNYVFIQEGKS